MVKGYTVLHSLSKRLQKRPRKEIQRMFKEERDSFHPVFRDAGVEDAFRLQAPLCHRLGEELKAELDPFFKSYFPEASVRDVVVLWSKPGEGDQTAHRDYSTPNTDGYNVSDYTQLPGSLLVCLNERIRVLAFGWNRLATDVNEAAMVTLEPGEIMIWRGDFIHAGTGYAENNVRIHCYLDPPNYHHPEDHTEIAAVVEPFSYPEAGLRCRVSDCTNPGRSIPDQKAWMAHMRRVHNLYMNAPNKRSKRAKTQ
ncbi:hypothetical protein PF010_g8316 [Phytophthora fragariae]|uniref:Fe2OG dioxygenase domain-containing protein n=1 Tax=Phytophthora fragariae TaxID=53985 RepID=A0A6G0LFV5_9STRA|nr:hypothetical protein PF010_g8316 [Phytophthora fragariae]